MDKKVSQHKRLAMGDRQDKRYKSGGPIITPRPAKVTAPVSKSPLTTMKRNNGVPGMKKGGNCGCK